MGNGSVFLKACDVIQSCETAQQIKVAKNWLYLLEMRHILSNDAIDDLVKFFNVRLKKFPNESS